MTGIILWESSCISSLLYNSSTWVGMGKEDSQYKAINNKQDFFL